MRNAGGEHARLAGAGAGQHQHGTIQRLHRLALLGIEAVEITCPAVRRGPRARGNAAGSRLVIGSVRKTAVYSARSSNQV